MTWSRKIVTSHWYACEFLGPEPIHVGDWIHCQIGTVRFWINALIAEGGFEFAGCEDIGDVHFVVPFIEVFRRNGVRLGDFGVYPEEAWLGHDCLGYDVLENLN